jgi:hypothetical protein
LISTPNQPTSIVIMIAAHGHIIIGPTAAPFRRFANPASNVVSPIDPTIGQVALCGM